MPFPVLVGNAGYILGVAGSKPGIIDRWKIEKHGIRADGKPRFVFHASFSFVNSALMDLPMTKRVFIEMLTKGPDGKPRHEEKELPAWEEWQFDGNHLTLKGVYLVLP